MGSPSLQTLADLFDAAPIGVLAIDEEGIIVYVNPRQCENSRLKREEIIGKHLRSTISTLWESQELLPHFDRLQQEGVSFEVTLPRYRRYSDGAVVAASIRGYKQGELTFLLSTAEKALEAEQACYEQLFENANDGIFIVSRDGRFVAVNQRFAELVGMPREEIIGKTTEIFLPGGFVQSLERIERTIKKGKFGPYELDLTTPLGKRAVSLNGFAYFEGDVPVGAMYTARDVTEERRRRQEQETFYQLAHDLTRSSDLCAMADHLFARGYILLDADYGFLMLANAEGTELRGVAAHGMDTEAFRQERIEVRKELAPAVHAFQRKQPVVIVDMAHSPLVSERLREKYYFVKTLWVVPLMSGESAAGVFCVGYATRREVTSEELRLLQLLGNEAALAIERARLTEELRESEEKYRSIFENASEGIFRSTPEGRFTVVNPALVRMLGYKYAEEVLALKLPDDLYVDPAQWGHLQAQYKASGVIKGVELLWKKKGGKHIVVSLYDRTTHDAQGRLVCYEGIVLDITEHKRMEQALRESIVQPKEISSNLRRFRKELRLSQEAFGRTFDGYTRRQINSYESGETDIPIALLLAIRNKGYPLNMILGPHNETGAIVKAIGYISSRRETHETIKKIAQGLLRITEQEDETVKEVLHHIGISYEEGQPDNLDKDAN